jgi:trimeric autotransporter adhesin
MKRKTLQLRDSVNRLHFRLAFLLIPLACLALSPHARGTCQDACLTNNNTVLGDDALLNNTATDNTGIGASALKSNTTGYNNTAIGSGALLNNTTGSACAAIGYFALTHNTTGNSNTATGWSALESNTTGLVNTAIGSATLKYNTTGSFNTAMGGAALEDNTTGISNTAIGYSTLFENTTGNTNTAIGVDALESNMTGYSNAAIGYLALWLNATGNSNTAIGVAALEKNRTGTGNTAVGKDALSANNSGNQNTAIGFSALDRCKGENSSGNIALGNAAGTALTIGKDNIYVGNPGQMTEANTIRIGTTETHTAAFIAGISGATVADGVGVVVGADGHLGTTTSSARYKQNIQPMDKASEAILSLKPVTFRYKPELDPDGIPQFGLVAEEVEKVNPDLVARDKEGKPYTVRYEAVNAMLLNEFLKEHKKTEKLEAAVASLIATVKEQAAQIQKVSAQLEVSKSAPQTVLNND